MGQTFEMGEALGRLIRAKTAAEARQALAERPQLLSDSMLGFARTMLSEAKRFGDEQTIKYVEPVLRLLEDIHAKGVEPALKAHFG